jgi:DNA-binding CsgD family transcriptional regulator
VPLASPLLDALERMGYGGMILGAEGEVLRLNAIAKRFLVEHTNISEEEFERSGRAQAALRDLLRRADPHVGRTADGWLPIPRDGRRQLILRAIPLQTLDPSDPKSAVVIIIDLNETPRLEPAAVQRIFDMSEPQAKLAVQLARGSTLSEISKAENISMDTARSHLAEVFAKTKTRRQHELISLMARLALLP